MENEKRPNKQTIEKENKVGNESEGVTKNIPIQLNATLETCLFANIKINNVPNNTMLIDTGSPVCGLSTKVFEKLNIRKDNLKETSVALQTASGTDLDVLGEIDLKLKIGIKTVSQAFIVAKLENIEGIVGMNFLESQNAEILITKKLLKVHDQEIKLFSLKTGVCARIKLVGS